MNTVLCRPPCWHSPVNAGNGAPRRMPCGSSARSRRSVSPRRLRWPNPLPPGPCPGRRPRPAPAPGPLPPRPRQAVCRDRPAGAGPCRAIDGGRSLSSHGDDLLAPPDGGGAGPGGSTVIIGSATRLPVRHLAQHRSTRHHPRLSTSVLLSARSPRLGGGQVLPREGGQSRPRSPPAVAECLQENDCMRALFFPLSFVVRVTAQLPVCTEH